MSFVVKVAGSGFSITWLAPEAPDGSYAFVPRKDAALFSTLAEALVAVDKATKAFGLIGMTFWVEVAD